MTRTATSTATSAATLVSGTHRYKYFKRPIMPRVNAFPPQILLAPTATATGGEGGPALNNPLVPLPTEVEAQVREAAVQTMFRESEAQTLPYTPQYVIPPGQAPEVLLLKNMTYEEGLPLGRKEIEMIEYARAKKDLEMNLPPFTDEASLLLRKRLMETQEMKEFKMREAEIDKVRQEKLSKLSDALQDREESNDFMTSQRLESVRLLRMEEREKALEKIRHKRIKALRRLAHERNAADPVLSEGTFRDIINDYFDKGSEVYVPLKRQGRNPSNPHQSGDPNDIASRAAPLDSLGNIVSLEYTIPKRLVNDDSDRVNPALLSKTGPPVPRASEAPRIRAAESRMTSAAQRSLRMTKRDVEEMHQILIKKKRDGGGAVTSPHDGQRPSSPKPASALMSALIAKKPKGRPPTPDLTHERNVPLLPPPPPMDPNSFDEPEPQKLPDLSQFHFDHDMQLATVLLQRLIRGRAVQNIMFEGKYRRRELINELKMADEVEMKYRIPDANQLDNAIKEDRYNQIRETSIDAIAGSASTNLLYTLAQEQTRVDMFAQFAKQSEEATKERRFLEAAEAGRRQREGLAYPKGGGADDTRSHTDAHHF